MKLRRATTSVFALFLGLVASAPRAAAQATDWKQIKAPALHAFHPQQPRRVELANGMVIFLQEDHELPLIRGAAQIRGGSRDEPAAKIGLVQIYGEVWRTGGTKSKTGDQLDDYLEAHAAKVETSGALESTTVSWDCLKENFDDVFKVFLEVLREPEFREDKLPLAKNQVNTSIARRNDDPFDIAFRESSKLVYGADSPYARVPEYATVATVTRDDLLSWHQQYVHPNNIILGVVGDFDSGAMEAKLHEAFDSWPKGPAAPKNQASFKGPKPGIYFVAKDDVTASTVQMVDLGTTRDNPDYYAIEVFNQFFGGSLSSRLFSNIRSKKGLAYAVGGGVGTEYDHPGILQLFLGTKSHTTAAAIDAFNVELDALKTNPATPEELTKAKDAILNSFVFRFDSKEKVLRERMTYEFYGYPADFLERYREGIAKVSIEDVSRVAGKYVHKDKLAILVVGKAADFDKPLSTYGPVTNLDITIPPPPGTAKAATASNSAGQALIAKVVQSLGGADKLRSVKSLREKSTILAKTPQGDMSMEVEEIAAFPDQLWQKMRTPMGEMTMVISPAAAFMKSPMGSQDLPGAQKEDGLKELRRHPIFVAQHADDPKFIFAAGGSEKIGEVEAQVLDVNADGAQVRWYVDPQTGHVLRTVAQSMGMGGPAEQVIDYSEWKEVEGISVPFKLKITQGGNEAGSQNVKELEINPAVDPKLFEKPSASGGSTGN
ncbi:MAG TPA: pitrilysin family protein [Terriglobia bacterium]|nr:pitrilysin family protein [Terriglobia bacterium]